MEKVDIGIEVDDLWGDDMETKRMERGKGGDLRTTAEGAHGDRLKIDYRFVEPGWEYEGREKRKSEKGKQN